jgi:hypothetical protein
LNCMTSLKKKLRLLCGILDFMCGEEREVTVECSTLRSLCGTHFVSGTLCGK